MTDTQYKVINFEKPKSCIWLNLWLSILFRVSYLFWLNFVIAFHYSILLACNKMEKASKIADYYNERYLIKASFMAFIFIGTQAVQSFKQVKLLKLSVKNFCHDKMSRWF